MTEAAPLALLLEDDGLIAMDVENTLYGGGFNVVTFYTCAEAEAWLKHNSPRVAVVDITLRDGPCTKAVRILIERNIPFIVHSGEMDRLGMPDVAFEAGTWIGKPSSSDRIIEVARSLAG
jgi:DNA-binding NtrC family response regulator